MTSTISLIASLDVKGVFVSELMFILMMEMGDNKQFPFSFEERDPRLNAFWEIWYSTYKKEILVPVK